MIRIWEVELRKSYGLDGTLNKRTLDVVANNPEEAMRRAVALQRKRVKVQFDDVGYKYPVSVCLVRTTSTPNGE